jgi:hypothetical protein
MSEHSQPTPDPLEEAIAAFRHMAVPDRPADADVLARLGPVSRPPFSKRRYLMRILVPSAAAALLLTGGLGLWLLNGTASVALAQVIQAAQKHKLVRYKQVETCDDKANNIVASGEYVCHADLKSPRTRSEHLADGDGFFLTIQSPERTLMISHKRQEATLLRGNDQFKGFLVGLQEFQRGKGVTSEREKLEDRDTIRYRLTEENKTVTLWVDATTKLPVKMIQDLTDPSPNVRRLTHEWSDFAWDPPLPAGVRNVDELFSTRPPEGYALDDRTNAGK